MPVSEWIRCSPFCLELKSSHVQCEMVISSSGNATLKIRWNCFPHGYHLRAHKGAFTASSLIMHYKRWHQLHMYSSRCTFVVLLLITPFQKVYHLLEEEKKSEGTHLCSSFKSASSARETLIKCMLYFTKKKKIVVSFTCSMQCMKMYGIVFIAVLCTVCWSALWKGQVAKVHYTFCGLLFFYLSMLRSYESCHFITDTVGRLLLLFQCAVVSFFIWPQRHSQF